MIFLSVCSGIEAASVAWEPLGWKARAFSEIEKFPAAVLAHHYPDVPNLGDMTKFKEWPDATLDLLVGGTPCQSFSVAGLRKGLDDPRGNLMLTYLAIADRYRPRWLVWENVPGVLSSNGGRDFGTFLGGLGELGYGFAYRVLDAQFFGVPQRRRRVFVVGHLGDWQRAAAVLFERESLSGNPAPSRKAGEIIAPTIRAGASNGGPGHGARSGDSKDELITVVAALTANAVGTCGADDNQGQAGHLIPMHTTGAGFWQEGMGTLRAREQDSHENLICMSTGQASAEIGIGIGTTLNCNHEAPIITHTLRGEGFDASEDGTGRGTPLVACFSAGQSSEAGSIAYQVEQAPTLRSGSSGTNMTPTLHSGMHVRRLTPRECERLQGFPDNYTNIPRGKKECPDGPRYKALGNSMAVPCMVWLGKRIQMVEDLNNG